MLLISSLNKPLLIIINMDILLCLHFHERCICSKPTSISWLIHRLLILYSTTQSRTSLSAAFVVDQLVLQKEKYPCNTIQVRTIQVQRCMPTNAQRACNYCTYRRNSISEISSEDVRLSIYFRFKVLNTLQNNMIRVI